MNKYIPHNQEEIDLMLKEIGVDHIDDLFVHINDNIKVNSLELGEPLSELELTSKMRALANENKGGNVLTSYIGAGAYDHYIPSIIDSLVSRQEFYTAYTPYQPEISQGTLQWIFEFQTMICRLTGMEVANASMYDGATAAAEAVNVARNVSKKNGVLIAASVHPETKKVVNTYSQYSNKAIQEIAMNNGSIDLDDLGKKLTDNIGAVVIQTPNFFGILEDISKISAITHSKKVLLIVIVDPISLAIFEAPGNLGADIVVGEGQSLGNYLNYGGPYVGFFATKEKYVRKMPGRLVGETVDVEGKRAYVLTIQTREQHIRREKATSNICSNQGLNALRASIYMSTMGKEGMKEVANQCLQKSHYAYDRLLETGKFQAVFKGAFFKEFTLKYLGNIESLADYLLEHNILFGYMVYKDYELMKNEILIAVTEKRTKEEIDLVAELIERFNG